MLIVGLSQWSTIKSKKKFVKNISSLTLHSFPIKHSQHYLSSLVKKYISHTINHAISKNAHVNGFKLYIYILSLLVYFTMTISPFNI